MKEKKKNKNKKEETKQVRNGRHLGLPDGTVSMTCDDLR